MQMRYRSRLVVVLLLTLIAVCGWNTQLPRVVDKVSAKVESYTPAPSPLLVVARDPEEWIPRSTLSIRNYLVDPTVTPPPVVVPKATVGSHILHYPLLYKTKITTYFSYRHRAIDFGAKCGAVVLAAYSGKITYAGWMTNGGGNVITLMASNGMRIDYDHLSSFLVTVGALVIPGQQIGKVGATGRATGCHLHFAVMRKGIWVNPLLYL